MSRFITIITFELEIMNVLIIESVWYYEIWLSQFKNSIEGRGFSHKRMTAAAHTTQWSIMGHHLNLSGQDLD